MIFVTLLLASVVAKKTSKLSATHVPTPYGYVHRDCYHEVPSGVQLVRHPQSGAGLIVNDKDGKRIGAIPACKVPTPFITKSTNNSVANLGTYDGWLAYTTFENKAGIDTFLGTFSVPNEPVGFFCFFDSNPYLFNFSIVPKNVVKRSGSVVYFHWSAR